MILFIIINFCVFNWIRCLWLYVCVCVTVWLCGCVTGITLADLVDPNVHMISSDRSSFLFSLKRETTVG